METRLSAPPVQGWDWEEARRRCMALAVGLLRSREDAEEAVQEALLRGWRHADSCRDRRNPVPWLMTITRRECARLARRRSERREAGLDVCSEHRDDRDPTEMVDSKVDLRTVVSRLPEGDQLVLNLRYDEQFTQGEVAKALGLPEGTVKTKLHRIRSRMRADMEVRNNWRI